jgi:hypothetical protein
MALDATFKQLQARLRLLHESLTELHTTVIEDHPQADDVVLVDIFGDAAEDMLGWWQEAFTAATQAQQFCDPPLNLEAARRALALCQEHFHRIDQRFTTDLVRYERVAELTRFGRNRGGEWRAWANSVKEALERSRQPLYDVGQLLFQCWQELTERAGILSVAVQATNIGQQITIPEAQDSLRQPLT